MKKVHLIFIVLVSMIYSCTNSGHYKFTIVDDITGEQLSAKVSITDIYGKTIDIDGNPAHVEYLGKRWCYTDGSFAVTTKLKGVNLEVRRGPETLPVIVTLDKGPQIIKLHRWIDMSQKGYMNGDVHAHTPFSKIANLQMKAEGLNVLNILVSDFVDNKYFTGKIDSASTPGHAIYVSQEVRDWQMGHLTLLGIKSLVPGYSEVSGELKTISNNPHSLMAHAMDDTHRQGGLVIWSHFSNLPGAESPIGIALGKVDGLELMTYDDPTKLPSHWSPWNNSGMSRVEFPVLRGMDLYYQYLNSGFHLPIVAGTDKMEEDIPMGSNRYYAYTKGDNSYKAWLAAIKSGSGFITNGPMLTFQVDGHTPGEIIDFHLPMKVHAKVSAQSILPFFNMEIIQNGWVVGKKVFYGNSPVNGIYSMSLDTTLVLDKSSWIAARVANEPNYKHGILPRGLTVFAHTNPVYFQKDGARVIEIESVNYLQKYVKGTIHWLETNPPFNQSGDQVEALKLAKDAYNIYESLKQE